MKSRKVLERLKRTFKNRDDVAVYLAGIVLPVLAWQTYSNVTPSNLGGWLILVAAIGMVGLCVLLVIQASLDILFDIPAQKTEQALYGLLNWCAVALFKVVGLLILIWMVWYVWTSVINKEDITENYSPATIESAKEAYQVPAEDLTEDQLDETQQAEVDEATNNCTGDCSGHQAGYEWAQDNGISSESDCDGNSDSFNEGCVNYVDGGSGY